MSLRQNQNKETLTEIFSICLLWSNPFRAEEFQSSMKIYQFLARYKKSGSKLVAFNHHSFIEQFKLQSQKFVPHTFF